MKIHVGIEVFELRGIGWVGDTGCSTVALEKKMIVFLLECLSGQKVKWFPVTELLKKFFLILFLHCQFH